MKAIIEEFGECPSLTHPNEPEKLITDHGGVLMKTVLIKGRSSSPIVESASLAPTFPMQSPSTPTPQPPMLLEMLRSTILTLRILSSNPVPAVLHRPGKMRSKRKVWIELRKRFLQRLRLQQQALQATSLGTPFLVSARFCLSIGLNLTSSALFRV